MSGLFGTLSHAKRHDIGSSIDHKGDIYDALIGAVNALSAANPAADQKYVLDEILAALKGLDWQESVLSREATQPATPNVGDRYIATATAGDWIVNNIYEWDGAVWIETVPNKGTTAIVEAEALAYTFIVTPSPAWVTLGSVIDHAVLNNLNWLAAGHTMDTDLPMNNNKVTGCPAIEGPVDSDAGMEAGLGFSTFSKLGDNAGVTAHEFRDSDNVPVAKIDSNGMATVVGADLGGQKAVNMADPTLDQDAATKKYVDDNEYTDSDAELVAKSVVSEPNQAINLYVNYIRGKSEVAGADGSLYNPFKTLQDAVDYGYNNYGQYGHYVNIESATMDGPSCGITPAETDVNIPPGMMLSITTPKLWAHYSIRNLTLEQFAWCSIINIYVSKVTEADNFSHNLAIFNSGVGDIQVCPDLTPRLTLDLYGAWQDNITVLIPKTSWTYGYWQSFNSDPDPTKAGNTLQTRAMPVNPYDLVPLRYITDTFKAPRTMLVSQDEGSNTDGNGWTYPFATVQKAIDEAIVRGWGEIDVQIDSSVNVQNINIPDGFKLNVFGIRRFTGQSAFNKITLGNNTKLSLDNANANDIEGTVDGNICELFLEEMFINGMTNYSGFKLIMTDTGLVDSTIRATWFTILGGVTQLSGTFYFTDNNEFFHTGELNLLTHKIVGVADPTSAQDAATKKYVDDNEYTDADAKDAVQYQSDVSLAGATPVNADVAGWADGNRGHGIGTTGREFYMVKRGTVVKYVELS